MAAVGFRRFTVLGAVLAFLLLAAGPAGRADEGSTTLQGPADWPMYGGSAGHAFSNAAAPPASLGEVWRLAGNATLGSAVEADGFVYVADVDEVPRPAGPNFVIHKLAEVNGSEASAADGWTARVSLTPAMTALAPARSLAVDLTRVYGVFTAFLPASSEYQEIVVAVSVADGSVAWTFTGTTPWTDPTPEPTASAATLIGSTVIFGSQDGSVYALNTANGAVLWSYDTGSPVQSVPAADGDIVYATAGSRLLFLDLQGTADGTQGTASAGGGDLLDEVMGAGPTVGSPVVDSSYVYFLAADNLSAVDKVFAGQPIWSETSPWLPWVGKGSPAITSSFVVVRRDDGRTYAYETATGRISWIRILPAQGDADMAFADGRLFLTGSLTGNPAIVTLDAATGDILDVAALPSAPLGAPVPAGDKVLVVSGSNLLAFRGQPDIAVLATDLVLNAQQAANGIARGNLTVAIRNLGDEPAVGVRVRVYDGAESPDNLIADFVVGNASDPVKAGGRSEGNRTATRDWSVGRHEVLVIADPVAHEETLGNNRAVTVLYVEPGPPNTIVVGAGPYYLALLLGFVIGAAVLYLPLNRLRALRRKEEERKP